MTKVQLAICLFTFLAALFWFLSAIVRVPHMFNAAEWNEREGVDSVPNALKRQSIWNAYGALSAGIAAVLQGLDFAKVFSN